MVFNVVVFTRAGVATARKARDALAACKTLGIPSKEASPRAIDRAPANHCQKDL